MKAEIINLHQFRVLRETESVKKAENLKALKRVEENKQSDSAKYNYDFYCLVDCFMRETYPDYAWKFGVWLEGIK